MSTLDRFLAARIGRRCRGRFIAFEIASWQLDVDERSVDPLNPLFAPVGGNHPSTFKTLRNARRAAGEDGFVLVFDPRMLPLVATEATHEQVDGGNELDEESFAERQLLYWERELAAIRARQGGTP